MLMRFSKFDTCGGNSSKRILVRAVNVMGIRNKSEVGGAVYALTILLFLKENFGRKNR